ncbi:MAG: hypothetical protein E3J43_02235 [Candidatus Heimdallarchaeota archaeon]|nr:MAG: hypothetical protein E3J43_02235 [Candidatus Heimdallarchaeota archaeon]
MFQVEKFSKLPKHQSLLERTAEVLIKDSRVRGIYVGGSQSADEFSDVDLSILCKTEEDRESLKKDRLRIAQEVGKLKAESMSGFPYVYVTFYEEEEVKVDYSFSIVPPELRPDKVNVTIIYDPDGHLEKMVKNCKKLKWELELDDLAHKIKHFHMGISYTVSKFLRGELWDGLDCVDFFRKYLVEFEDAFAQRKKENYRRIEQKLDSERLKVFDKTLFSELTRENLFKGMDAILEYMDRFLKEKFLALGIFPEGDAKRMREYYNRKKKECLEGK